MSANQIELKSPQSESKQENQPKSVIIVYQHKQSDSSNNNVIINFSSHDVRVESLTIRPGE